MHEYANDSIPHIRTCSEGCRKIPQRAVTANGWRFIKARIIERTRVLNGKIKINAKTNMSFFCESWLLCKYVTNVNAQSERIPIKVKLSINNMRMVKNSLHKE